MNFIVADDHELIRESLRAQLMQLEPDATIFEAGTANEVLQLMSQGIEINLVLLDLYMPDCQGPELVSTLCDRFPETPIVVVSGSESAEDIAKSIDCGAAGFIPKSTAREVIKSAIRLVLSGGVYIPERMVRQPGAKKAGRSLNPADIQTGPSNCGKVEEILTRRQLQVLKLICAGLPNKLIARELNISLYTVKVHVAAVLRALGKDNRTAAAIVAEQQGLCTENRNTPEAH